MLVMNLSLMKLHITLCYIPTYIKIFLGAEDKNEFKEK